MLNVLIDTSVIFHQLADKLKNEPDILSQPRVLAQLVKSHLVYIDGCDWLTEADNGSVKCLWCLDVKDEAGVYWRQHWLDDRGYEIRYKAGRRPKDSLFLEISRIGREFLGNHCNVYGEKGFEADDVAALASQHYEGKFLLLTVDTDWIGLVSDRVMWVNTHEAWKPRVRKDLETINNWAKTNKGMQCQPLDYPSQIWQIKAQFGDKSDNLPPNSPIEVISLLEPAMKPATLPALQPCRFSERQKEQAAELIRMCGVRSPVAPLTL